jgi:hypothetical protein
MHPPTGRAVPAGRGMVDKGGAPLVAPLRAGVDERRQTCGQMRKSQVCADQRCDAATGPARMPAAQALVCVALAP